MLGYIAWFDVFCLPLECEQTHTQPLPNKIAQPLPNKIAQPLPNKKAQPFLNKISQAQPNRYFFDAKQDIFFNFQTLSDLRHPNKVSYKS